jgi:hypothetical protein
MVMQPGPHRYKPSLQLVSTQLPDEQAYCVSLGQHLPPHDNSPLLQPPLLVEGLHAQKYMPTATTHTVSIKK